jgi:hypothetical protein
MLTLLAGLVNSGPAEPGKLPGEVFRLQSFTNTCMLIPKRMTDV